VAALLGDTSRPAQDFAADTEVGIFDNTAEAQTVPVLLADQYLASAEKLARAVDVKTLTGCDPASAMGSACVRSFVTSFGWRAYRRPLAAPEVERYQALYTNTASASDAQTGVRAIVAAMLSAPSFLFKPEYGGAASKIPGAMNAAPFELATRLASLIWASIPDDVLLDAAQNGQLSTPDQVTAQARRMLADPKAIPAVRSFYTQWLGLPLLDAATKDSTAYPQWSEDLRADAFGDGALHRLRALARRRAALAFAHCQLFAFERHAREVLWSRARDCGWQWCNARRRDRHGRSGWLHPDAARSEATQRCADSSELDDCIRKPRE